jgi:hypothetical protein
MSREAANPPELVIEVSGTQTASSSFTVQSLSAPLPLVSAPSATATVIPTDTPTDTPTSTPLPTATFTPVVVPTDTPTNTPLPTATTVPTDTPTNTPLPTATFTLAPSANLQIVESDAAGVYRQGNWTSHDTTAASGGQYIYSSGSPDDTLTTYFEGTQAVVVYVKHPALGVFGIEIDGVLQQQVDSTAPDSEFGALATVDGLAGGQHTLRVYPISGTIAIDAFAFETPLMVTPTPAPVVVPTDTPLPTATLMPEVVPTDTPLPTATEAPTNTPVPEVAPTSTPTPAQLPFEETFDSGSGWTATGSWTVGTQSAYNRAGWFADSTQRGEVSTLTSDMLIDLRGAAHPQISFWQKAALSTADKFAIEISGDGGSSWTALTEQVGLANDWTQLVFDLSPYKDRVIRLRYRLDTGDPLPKGTATTGVWIDELSIVDVPPAPGAAPSATPKGAPAAPSTSTPTPTSAPTDTPTATATDVPTNTPTATPTDTPTATPTDIPTATPTNIPTNTLTATPTSIPTPTPTNIPTDTPTMTPTSIPTPTPTNIPTDMPTGALIPTATLALAAHTAWFPNLEHRTGGRT